MPALRGLPSAQLPLEYSLESAASLQEPGVCSETCQATSSRAGVQQPSAHLRSSGAARAATLDW